MKNSKNIIIHPSSIVDTQDIGQDSKIWAFVHILAGVKIGNNANICDHCFIEDEVIIGDNVTIKSGVWIWNGVIIGDNVFIGPSVAFANDKYPRSKNVCFAKKRTILNNGCSIGANSTILPGITIGNYAMIGAGSVVTKNVNDYEIVYGNPAVPKGYVCQCGVKMNFTHNAFQCACGLSYEKNDEQIVLI